jgi:Flp pilus assembly CpaE family ATPase
MTAAKRRSDSVILTVDMTLAPCHNGLALLLRCLRMRDEDLHCAIVTSLIESQI